MNLRPMLIALVVLAQSVASCAPKPVSRPTARLMEFGIIQPAGKFARQSDPNTAAGYTSRGSGESVFTQRTTEVPAAIGSAFGIQYRVENIAPGEDVTVEEIIRYPPITKPNGQVVTEEKTQDRLTSQAGSIDRKFFYRLSAPHEVVQGDWSLAVTVNGKMVINQHFTLELPK